MYLSRLLALFFIFSIPTAWGLNIASYNIRNFDTYGTQGKTNTQELKKILSSLNADIIAVQEIVNDEAFKSFIATELPDYKIQLSQCGGRGKQKLGVLYRTSTLRFLDFYSDDTLNERKGCEKGLRPAGVALFQEKKTGLKFRVFSLHLKAGGKQHNADIRYKQYQTISQILSKLYQKGESHFILMGDFNTTDYLERNHNYNRFVNFVEFNGLIDLATGIECSAYWSGGQNDDLFHPSLLDHILISTSLLEHFHLGEVTVESHCKKAQCQVRGNDDLGTSFKEVSDHCPVLAKLN